MVLSHADNDHAVGLVGVMQHFKVKNLWMNRPWLYADQVIDSFHGNFSLEGLIQDMRDRHSYLVELEELAVAQGTIVHQVFQGAQIGPFKVLSPEKQRYISAIPDLDKTPTSYAKDESFGGLLTGVRTLVEKAKTWLEETWHLETLSENPGPTSVSNETSIVQYGQLGDKLVMLTADAGPTALKEAVAYALKIGMNKIPDMIQVPHHGSRRNVTPSVLDALLGGKVAQGQEYGKAYCSIGKEEKDYPRGQVKNAFTRRGYPVRVTRGKPIYYFGDGAQMRPGWVPIMPEPFATEVEA
jgi:hypothetical protein